MERLDPPQPGTEKAAPPANKNTPTMTKRLFELTRLLLDPKGK
jgi:hypothetical protein